MNNMNGFSIFFSIIKLDILSTIVPQLFSYGNYGII